jgi:hypothetical protein
LHYCRNELVCQLLLKKGANVALKDNKYESIDVGTAPLPTMLLRVAIRKCWTLCSGRPTWSANSMPHSGRPSSTPSSTEQKSKLASSGSSYKMDPRSTSKIAMAKLPSTMQPKWAGLGAFPSCCRREPALTSGTSTTRHPSTWPTTKLPDCSEPIGNPRAFHQTKRRS